MSFQRYCTIYSGQFSGPNYFIKRLEATSPPKEQERGEGVQCSGEIELKSSQAKKLYLMKNRYDFLK